ncbi:MAG: hypothetical protein RMJ33_09290 [Saprospiraceae bacterium]|nr:hypothetical protein [Saprospiraceae bacterium]MDW8230018.1 hypothetical protein [Saprospiraceae bacterium]
MKRPLSTLAYSIAGSLLILLFIDPVRIERSCVSSEERLEIHRFRREQNFWTTQQAEHFVNTGRLGRTPECAVVPLLFSPAGFLLNAREYNSRKYCRQRWYYTDLATFHRVTRERTATPDYAKILGEYRGAPIYAYDPYALYQQTREEEVSHLLFSPNPEVFALNPAIDFARLEERSLNFQSGDILIRPNLVLFGLCGSAPVPPDAVGSGWGHAAGISRTSAAGADIDHSLREAYVIEAWGPELPREHQLRETKACVPGRFELSLKTFPIPNENYWCKKRKGSRFRLRADLSEAQREAIAGFWRQQMKQKDGYSIFARKRFPCSPTVRSSGCNRPRIPECATDDWADGSDWYCSLLVWQAYYWAADLDIDANGGVYVFPNDIIRSPVFHNTAADENRRVRF